MRGPPKSRDILPTKRLLKLRGVTERTPPPVRHTRARDTYPSPTRDLAVQTGVCPERSKGRNPRPGLHLRRRERLRVEWTDRDTERGGRDSVTKLLKRLNHGKLRTLGEYSFNPEYLLLYFHRFRLRRPVSLWNMCYDYFTQLFWPALRRQVWDDLRNLCDPLSERFVF